MGKNSTDSFLALGVTPLLTYTNSDLDNKENMSWFFTGLIDAEGCFTIGVYRDKKNKVGFGVKLNCFTPKR